MQPILPVSQDVNIQDLPNPQVLLDYLDLYTQNRTKENESILAKIKEDVKYGYETALSYFGRQKPVDDQITALVGQVKKEINQAKTFEQWYTLIFTLRECAARAQGFKYSISNSTSKLSETLHALAGIIIYALTENSKFKSRVSTLQAQSALLYAHAKYCIDKKDGIGSDADKKKRKEIILILAKLGDNTAIDEVMDGAYKEDNDLNYLKRPEPEDRNEFHCEDRSNVAVPLCLQHDFFRWLYEKTFQQLNRIDLERFISRAALKGIQENQGTTPVKFEKPATDKPEDMDEEAVMEILRLSTEEIKRGITLPAAITTDTPAKVSEKGPDNLQKPLIPEMLKQTKPDILPNIISDLPASPAVQVTPAPVNTNMSTLGIFATPSANQQTETVKKEVTHVPESEIGDELLTFSSKIGAN